jgi:hypothetical protein
VTFLLEYIQQVLQNDVELSKMVRFRIQEKGSNDKSRLAKLQEYEGPDPDTMKVLRHNYHRWFQDPSTFWMPPSLAWTESTNPQAQIVDGYLQASTLSDM